MDVSLDRMIRPDVAAVLIAGPTASGKSRLALDLARRHGGIVVNADSMQVYRELRILSARPDVADEQAAPHRLYGHVGASERYSVARWLSDVRDLLGTLGGALPIFVGGTGLYFKGLIEGLTSIPPIPPHIRGHWEERAAAGPIADLHAELARRDAEGAALLRPSDRTRIVRALEVIEATGRPLRDWQREKAGTPLLSPDRVVRAVIEPDRAWLHRRIGERVDAMIAEGAMEEARALGALGLSPELPAMKAIGVRQLLDHQSGKLSREEALAAMKTETRRYAKRQSTWFRNQTPDWTRIGSGN
jgi:tRNA dimethylallyltransferase